MLSPKSQGPVVLPCSLSLYLGSSLGGGKQLEYFQIPSCCAFLGLRRPHGITILVAGRGQSRRVLGLESVQHREGLEQAERQDEYLQYHSSTVIP